MAEEGFFHGTGGIGGFEVLGRVWGAFGTVKSDDEMLDRGRVSEFNCGVGHRGLLRDFANGRLDG